MMGFLAIVRPWSLKAAALSKPLMAVLAPRRVKRCCLRGDPAFIRPKREENA
jgi:hypothetical protein